MNLAGKALIMAAADSCLAATVAAGFSCFLSTNEGRSAEDGRIISRTDLCHRFDEKTKCRVVIADPAPPR